QFKLYNLIWQRTIASQMNPAVLDTMAVDLKGGEGDIFRANGSVVTEPGFMQVYQEGFDDEKPDQNAAQEEKLLPPLKEGQSVQLQEIRNEQHFTEPPPRFTEASLVKVLEEYGI